MAGSRAGRLLLPLLCACAALEEPGASAAWTTHQGLNCWDGDKGGIRLRVEELPYHNPVHDTDELEEMSLENCRRRCAEDASCEGILTIHRHVEAGQPPEGPCWLRRNLSLGACIKGTPWDLHVLEGRSAFVAPSVPAPAPVLAPAPAPAPVVQFPARAPFDCQADLAQWETRWSVPKKEYCCSVQGVNCRGTLPTYDCTAAGDDWVVWSTDQQAWCCEHTGVGCASGKFDCNAGRWNWKAGWSEQKKAYCCSTDGVSCGGSSYRVDVGVPLWLLNLLLLLLLLVLILCLALICFYAGCCGGRMHRSAAYVVRQPVSEPLIVKTEEKPAPVVKTETVVVEPAVPAVKTETVVVEPVVEAVVVAEPPPTVVVEEKPPPTVVVVEEKPPPPPPTVVVVEEKPPPTVVVVEEKPPPPPPKVVVVEEKPPPTMLVATPTPVAVTERVFLSGDHLLGVEAPGYGPMVVTQSDRATADPLRSTLDYSYGRLMNQFVLSGARRYY